MSSYDTWLNVLTGISQGSFDKVYLRDASGNMVDLLTLLAGAGGTVTSATLPLSINSGALNLDVSGFCTSASSPLSLTGGQMTIDLTSYSTTTQMNATVAAALAPYVLTTTLGSYSTTAQMNTAITNALATYVTNTALTNALAAYIDTTTLNTLLATKQNSLTAGTGISLSLIHISEPTRPY